MDKNKIILTSLVIINFLALVAIIILLSLRQQPSSQTGIITADTKQTRDTYTAVITEFNRYITGQITRNQTTENLNPDTLGSYANLSFDPESNLLWVWCPDTYTITEPVSTTNNKLSFDPNIGTSIELITDESNSITFTCSKQ